MLAYVDLNFQSQQIRGTSLQEYLRVVTFNSKAIVPQDLFRYIIHQVIHGIVIIESTKNLEERIEQQAIIKGLSVFIF